MNARQALTAFVAFVSLSALVAGAGCDKFKPKPKKAYGEDCTQDLDCESSTCTTYGSVCSKSCTYNKDCEGGLVCRAKDEGAGSVCSKPIGSPPNGGCMSGADCQHGWCLKKVGESNEPGICSHYCQASDDCPAGMKICDSISDSGMLKMCPPGDEKAPAASRPKFGPPQQGKKPAATKPAASGTPAPTGAQPTATATPSATASAKAAPDAGAPPAAPPDAGSPAAPPPPSSTAKTPAPPKLGPKN